MNGQPHVHSAYVTRTYPHMWKGGWFVRYGDTEVRFAWSWQRPDTWSDDDFDKAVARAARKAIVRHDRGSRKAAASAARIQANHRRAYELRHRPIDLPKLELTLWGDEQLKKLEEAIDNA